MSQKILKLQMNSMHFNISSVFGRMKFIICQGLQIKSMLSKKLKDLFQRFWPVTSDEPVDPNRLGQILLRMESLTEKELKIALEIKAKKSYKLLGRILIEEGFCSQEQAVYKLFNTAEHLPY